ncbi:unnamed protein product [Effrenium voratum]|nr:unnamed protein product [Effrenium voratum]
MAEKLAEWRGCIAQLVNLENAKCTGRSQEALSIDDAEVAHVLSSLHRLVESLAAAGELRDVLDRDVTSANLVLRFLAEQSHEVLGFNAAGKALKAILQVPSWKEMFELWGLQHAVSQECRFKLSKEGILVEERHSKKTSFLDRDHSETTHGLLRHELYETAQQLAERGARIVVLGDRGTGKSSLCNAAFGRQLAQTGVGRSVTQLITLYPATESCPVNLYDTKGFETDGDQLEQLKKLVEERRRASERHNVEDPARVSELLHLVWWVVDVISGGRFNPGHMQKVCSLLHKNGIPVIIVLNKCDAPEDFVRGDCPAAARPGGRFLSTSPGGLAGRFGLVGPGDGRLLHRQRRGAGGRPGALRVTGLVRPGAGGHGAQHRQGVSCGDVKEDGHTSFLVHRRLRHERSRVYDPGLAQASARLQRARRRRGSGPSWHNHHGARLGGHAAPTRSAVQGSTK